ncbi:MAG: PP2C family serine/threonine-protein phosphatase [Candidatus Thiodiazotropha sp.]
MKNWRCTGASVVGQSHARFGTPCQDAHAWAQLNDILILASADGAGSAKHAEWGSAQAVEAAVEHIITHILARPADHTSQNGTESLLGAVAGAFAAARDTAVDLADRKQVALRDLASTLLVAVVSGGCIAVGQVGDGAIVGSLGGDAGFRAITKPFHGRYINETAFITQENYTDYLQLQVIEGEVREIAVFSDGFETVAINYATGKPNSALFSGLFQFMSATPETAIRLEALRRLLSGERIAERSDDDKTVILATCIDDANTEQTCA